MSLVVCRSVCGGVRYIRLFAGPFVVVWRRQRRVLSARDVVVVRDDRFSLVDGHSLRITAVQPADQASYTCALDTEPLSELTHRLEVLCECHCQVTSV